ncbi:MAG TPA: HAMP domain-containing methyl-accepting chemotaxis protein, partial [Pseudomonadales bacterium]|nr:HAMP domain-containing methyl-accepting chemotaxis protein [Pseudomonadales bacterium]
VDALISSIVPLAEAYDFDSCDKIISTALEQDQDLSGLRYRLEKNGKYHTVGKVDGDQLQTISATRKTNYADVQVDYIVRTDSLKSRAESSQAAYTKIENEIKAASSNIRTEMTSKMTDIAQKLTGELKFEISILALFIAFILVVSMLWMMHKLIIAPIRTVKNFMLNISNGNLTEELRLSSASEIEEMVLASNAMVQSLREITRKINSSVAFVATQAQNLQTTTTHLAHGARTQSSESEQAAGAVTELSHSFTEVSRAAADASKVVKSSSERAETGQNTVSKMAISISSIATTVDQASAMIQALGRSSEEIGRIISVIEGIANQTNLLALNAAIEAARAGEQGRGFAVVADEVRSLAARTSEATLEISHMIEKIRMDTQKSVESMNTTKQQVEEGVALANSACREIGDIAGAAAENMNLVSHIATAISQQSIAAESVSSNVERIAAVTRTTEESVNAIQSAVIELSRLSDELKTTIGWFTLNRK